MNILVSFNNVYQFPGFPLLGVLDADTLSLQIVDLPPQIPRTGILGLAQSSRFIYVGLQYAFDGTASYRIPPQVGLEYSKDGTLASRNPCSLLVFDKHNFRLLHQYYFKLIQDVHSFLLSEDEETLYVVSTGSDEVIEMQLKDEYVVSEKVYWRPEGEGERADHHHLNSICQWNGDVIVSGFGKKEIADDWNTARNGFVYNISKSGFIHMGLLQPHSLIVIDGRLALCESRQKRFVFIDDGSMIDVRGYSRGACHLDGHLFIGTSARRIKSKSTGKQNKNTESDPTGCTVSKNSLTTPGQQEVVHLDHCANEIYEFLPIEKVGHWPLIPAADYRILFSEAWENQRQLVIAEINGNLEEKVTALILVDEELLGLKDHFTPDLKVHSFIEKDGVYWGPPENDVVAIEEMKRIKREHPHHVIAFAWPAFWWLDSYSGLHDFLKSNYHCTLKNDRVILFMAG